MFNRTLVMGNPAVPKPVSILRPFVGSMVLAAVIAVTNAASLIPRDALADSEKAKEAEALRRAAQAKAKSHVGYPDIFDYVVRSESSSTDYIYLSRQIEQLSRYLRDVSRALENTVPLGLPVPSGSQNDIKAVYGSDGPTIKSVSTLLEYRLMVAGNPHLKVGRVTEEGTAVRAEIVTKDGSLVDAYLIDKITGALSPVR